MKRSRIALIRGPRPIRGRVTRVLTIALAAAAVALLAAILFAAGCDRGQEAPAGGPQPLRGQPASRPPAPVAVAAVTSGTISSYHEATATLEAEKQAEVLARVSGVVASLGCEEGDHVEAGQELLRIENDEYRLLLKQAEAATGNVRARHDRLAQMVKEDLASQEEYEAVRSELASSEAEEGLARLRVSYLSVAAPFSGRIVERLVDPGQTVSEGTPLFAIADFEPLLARFYVPAKEFGKLRVDQPVELVLDSTGERLVGRISLISPTIDPTSGTIKITLRIDDYPETTRPGDFASVHVVTERHQQALLVPKTAVVSEKGQDVVYVATADTAQQRPVRVGFMDDTHAEILEGLSSGELVVVKGQRSLEPGAPLKILEGGNGAIAESAADSAAGSDTRTGTAADGAAAPAGATADAAGDTASAAKAG